MRYQVNDSVVHKTHGVGIIRAVERRVFENDREQTFYILEIQDCGAPKKKYSFPLNLREKD